MRSTRPLRQLRIRAMSVAPVLCQIAEATWTCTKAAVVARQRVDQPVFQLPVQLLAACCKPPACAATHASTIRSAAAGRTPRTPGHPSRRNPAVQAVHIAKTTACSMSRSRAATEPPYRPERIPRTSSQHCDRRRTPLPPFFASMWCVPTQPTNYGASARLRSALCSLPTPN